MTTMTWQVRDGSRIVTFDGVKLGESSSQRPTSPRWTELALYRTDSGKYVLSKIGRSLVLHMPGCWTVHSKLSRFVDEYPLREPDEDEGWTFHACVPDEYDLDMIEVEETRWWAIVADGPHEVVEHLQRREEGVSFMPRMAVNLLEQAAQADQAIADAFYIEHIG